MCHEPATITAVPLPPFLTRGFVWGLSHFPSGTRHALCKGGQRHQQAAARLKSLQTETKGNRPEAREEEPDVMEEEPVCVCPAPIPHLSITEMLDLCL